MHTTFKMAMCMQIPQNYTIPTPAIYPFKNGGQDLFF